MSVISKKLPEICTIPETQTPDVFTLTPGTASHIREPPKVWGRLYSTHTCVQAVDLENSTFRLGRSEQCDVVITDSNLKNAPVISKTHFTINRENNNIVYIEDNSKNGTFLNGKLIGKGKHYILQNDDDIAIGVKGLKVFNFKVIEQDANKYLPPALRMKYQISHLLGNGACGEVRLALHKFTCKQYAVKRIIKSESLYKLNHRDKIKMEVEILQQLRDPNIISMREIVETEDSVFIILKYMEGGELTKLILGEQRLTETESKFLFYQILLGLRYLHSKNIVHRDLKPENLLLSSSEAKTIIKISDFGLSKFLNEDGVLKTICGTLCYAAPEVLNREIDSYNQKADIWSLGVILYYMLSQEHPFRESDSKTLIANILLGNLSFSQSLWSEMSAICIDLITKMLTVDPLSRISIEQIMLHPWIHDDTIMQAEVERMIYSTAETITLSSSDSEESPVDSSFMNPPAKRSRLSEN